MVSFPQTAQLELKTGITKNSVTYAAATTIYCKREKKLATAMNMDTRELIQFAFTVYYTNVEVSMGDKIDGVLIKSVEELTDGLDGSVIYYKATMAS